MDSGASSGGMGGMPRLGESMQFLQWVEMFLAWMEFRCERLRPLLDPTGQMLPPAAPAAATTEQASARSGLERALHAALVLATGPVSGDPGKEKAYSIVQEFKGKPFSGTAAFSRLCEVYAPGNDDTLVSMYLRLMDLAPAGGTDYVAVCDAHQIAFKDLVRKIHAADADHPLSPAFLSALMLRRLPEEYSVFKEMTWANAGRAPLVFDEVCDGYRSAAVRLQSDSDHDKPVAAFNTRAVDKQREPRRCHNCNGVGHIAPVCPKPKSVCGSCSGPHLTEHCAAVQRIKANRARYAGTDKPAVVNFMTAVHAAKEGARLPSQQVAASGGELFSVSLEAAMPTGPVPACLAAGGGAVPGGGIIQGVFYLDTCAQQHMGNDPSFFKSFGQQAAVGAGVLGATGSSSPSQGVGTVAVEFQDDKGHPVEIEMHQVIYCPSLMANLVSWPVLQKQGHTLLENCAGLRTAGGRVLPLKMDCRGFPYFMQAGANNDITDPGTLALLSHAASGAQRIAGGVLGARPSSEAVQSVNMSTQTPEAVTKGVQHAQALKMLQHRSLAHLSEGAMNTMARKRLATGISIDAQVQLPDCGPCKLGKSTRVPLKVGGASGPPGDSQNIPEVSYSRLRTGAEKQDIHYADMYGPVAPKSVNGFNQLLGVVAAKTGVMQIYGQKNKARVLQGVQTYHTNVMQIEHLRTDNDQVFRSEALADWCAASGIQLTNSAPYTPEQLAGIERQWRTLNDAVCTMLEDSGLPGEFWELAAQYAVYVRNRCPRASNTGEISPYQAHTSCVPDLSALHPFGCKAYLHLPKARRKSKLQPKALEGIFVGVQMRSNTFKVWVPESMERVDSVGRLYESRDVRFDDNWTWKGAIRLAGAAQEGPVAAVGVPDVLEELLGVHEGPLVDLVNEAADGAQEEQEPVPEEEEQGLPPFAPPEQPLRRSARSNFGRAPAKWWMASTTGAGADIDTDSEDGALEYDGSGDEHEAYFTLLEDAAVAFLTRQSEAGQAPGRLPDPTSTRDALTGDPDKVRRWRASREREFASLRAKGVYVEVNAADVPPGSTMLRLHEIHKYKTDKHGNQTEKSRAVCLGNRQVAGRDFSETFAPVTKFTTIRMICSIAAAKGWELRQFDVETAFLYAPLKEENIYVIPPDDFRLGSDGQEVRWHLKRSLYGLRQSPKNWYDDFTGFLIIECGFVKSANDPCLLVAYNSVGDLECALAVYVDDVPAGVANPDFYTKFITKIKGKYNLTEGPLEWVLGIEVIQSPGRVELRQTQYVEAVLDRFGSSHCNPKKLPLRPGSVWSIADSPNTPAEQKEVNEQFRGMSYRSFVGATLYLAVGTRPDLACAVSKMAHVQSKPGKVHHEQAKHLLGYLQGTKHLGLVFSGSLPHENTLTGYVDASFADCPDSSKSTTGYCFFLNGAVVSWYSKRQGTVAQSTTEAEYIGTAPASCEAVNLRALAEDLGIPQKGPTVLFEDNYGCFCLTKDEVLHRKTKHIAVKYHKVRELVRKGVVKIEQVATDEQNADILTKMFKCVQEFDKFRSRLLGYSPLTL